MVDVCPRDRQPNWFCTLLALEGFRGENHRHVRPIPRSTETLHPNDPLLLASGASRSQESNSQPVIYLIFPTSEKSGIQTLLPLMLKQSTTKYLCLPEGVCISLNNYKLGNQKMSYTCNYRFAAQTDIFHSNILANRFPYICSPLLEELIFFCRRRYIPFRNCA
jgi:hypothetical protein